MHLGAHAEKAYKAELLLFFADTVEVSEGVVKLAYTLLLQIPKSPAS